MELEVVLWLVVGHPARRVCIRPLQLLANFPGTIDFQDSTMTGGSCGSGMRGKGGQLECERGTGRLTSIWVGCESGGATR